MVNNIHHPIQYKYVNIEDVNMFYREAGEKTYQLFYYYMAFLVHHISLEN